MKNRKHHEVSLTLDGLENLKNQIRNSIIGLKQKIKEIQEITQSIKSKNKELGSKNKKHPFENLFNFTEIVDREKEHIQIDLELSV